MSVVRVSRSVRRLGIAFVLLGVVALVSWMSSGAGAAGAPALTMTPSPTSRPYTDGQSITLAVGANSRFAPNTRIEVLECAAPNGVLPIDDTTCDGNTVQYRSVLVAADGSFQVPAYTVYQLPNTVLGEQSNKMPVCNAVRQCVLYIGQDQNDFTQPKMFSPPFTVGSAAALATGPSSTASVGSTPSGGSTPAGGSGAQPGTGDSTPAPVSPGVALSGPSGGSGTLDPGVSAPSAGSLAFTGIDQVPVLVGIGMLLMVLGTVGIHVRRRAAP